MLTNLKFKTITSNISTFPPGTNREREAPSNRRPSNSLHLITSTTATRRGSDHTTHDARHRRCGPPRPPYIDPLDYSLAGNPATTAGAGRGKGED